MIRNNFDFTIFKKTFPSNFSLFFSIDSRTARNVRERMLQEIVTLLLPVVTLLTRKALQMVDVRPRPHHHLEGRNGFVTGRAVAGESKQSVAN